MTASIAQPRGGLLRNTVAVAALIATVVLALTIGRARADQPAGWPELALPPGVEAYSISPRMTVDGTPTELQGFESAQPPLAVAAWFRVHLPAPLLEDTLGDKLVLGHPAGMYYITIVLEAAGEGTRAVVSVADMQGAQVQRAQGDKALERVLAGFPAGTRAVRSITSAERARSAVFLTLVNSYSEEVNRDRLVQLLRDDGLQLEREVQPDAASLAQLPDGAPAGTALFFKGAGKEATAVIARGADSQVTIVLNTVTTMEHYQ